MLIEDIVDQFKLAGFKDIISEHHMVRSNVHYKYCTAEIKYIILQNNEVNKLSLSNEKYIRVETLETDAAFRGNGYAKFVLKQIFNLADKLNMPVKLSAEPFSENLYATVDTLQGLVRWYEKQGFAVKQHYIFSVEMTKMPSIQKNKNIQIYQKLENNSSFVTSA